MNKQFLVTVATGMLLNACATPQANLSSFQASELQSVSVPNQWEAEVKTSALTANQIGWLTRFNDTSLKELVSNAYVNNPDLKRLQARLDRAKALSTKARAGLSPIVNGSVGASRTDSFRGADNPPSTLNAGIDVSWEPDLWGRIDVSSQAGSFRVEAAREDYRAGQHVLAASIIENYFLAIEARKLTEVSQSNLDALNETLGFVTVQYERGLRSAQDISLIRADVASAKVSNNRSAGAARDASRALEILIGFYPKIDRLTVANLPEVPEFTAIGQPANILVNRPDLQAAHYRVRAAYSGHLSAKLAQKPNLSLSGFIGSTSSSVGQLFDPSAMASTLFSNLTAPIFNAGARKADIKIAQADIDEALANYQDVSLDAFRDVERQIDEGKILAKQEMELTQALSDARDALRFTQFRYESAESDLLNVLQVQQRVSFIEGQLVSTRRARLVQYINLSLSLGVEPTEII